MPQMTRRSLFVLGGSGAAGLAVAGCGEEDDPRGEGRDEELLTSAADAEAALGASLSTEGTKPTPEFAAFEQTSKDRLSKLEELGATSSDAPVADALDRSVAEAITATNPAIAAYREGVRFLSTEELRATAIQFLTQVSAEQATLRGLQGDDQSPTPFVTGLDDKPYVASEDDEDAEDEE